MKKLLTGAAILLGLAVSTAATAVADGQFGNGNVSQTGGGTSSHNGTNSVTSIRINDHSLVIRDNNRVWIDGTEVFGQQATDAMDAARSGQPWW